jgi:hypothetical protein
MDTQVCLRLPALVDPIQWRLTPGSCPGTQLLQFPIMPSCRIVPVRPRRALEPGQRLYYSCRTI